MVKKSLKRFSGNFHELFIFMNLEARNLTLAERIEIQKTTIHWLPYQRLLDTDNGNGTCPERPRAIEEFPEGWWTRKFSWLVDLFDMSRIMRILIAKSFSVHRRREASRTISHPHLRSRLLLHRARLNLR